MKQTKTQQFCLKLHSSFLARHNWNVNISINDARKSIGTVIALADSQILTWINELNGTENCDEQAKNIQKQIKFLKKKKNSKQIKEKIANLYDELYKIQFKTDYLCLIIDNKADYFRANQGFFVNGVEYRRLLATTGGVKMSTVIYTSVKLHDELKRRIENGRNVNVPLVPAKLGAYEALCASASVPVSFPHGVIVVKDCEVEFEDCVINIDDSDTTQEPLVQYVEKQKIKNNVSDGCSMMLPSLAKRWNIELTGEDDYLSGCNLRCAWMKGMTFCFDFIEWFEKNADSFIITDVWGDKRDVRDAELIVTESQLKLWSSYANWEDYYNKCMQNHYSLRITKTAPHQLDNVRQLNYQFVQPFELSNEDVEELIAPTVSEISDIVKMDYRKSIVYLCGENINEKNIEYMDCAAKALMIDKNMINDPYISNKIRKMIQKRIREAKIGVLNAKGNFQIISGDLIALCESMAGKQVHGVLNAGEIYSNYWSSRNVKEVVCFRAPMSNAHSIRKLQINNSEEANYWFRYIKTCMIVNGWDTMAQALNGFDYDGDLVYSTNNEVLLRNHVALPALNCIQYNSAKKVVTEEDVVNSNVMGFGSKIGSITNRITAMTSLMSYYDKDSEEYQTLKYRTQCGQLLQQAEIDKIKGILPNPMPKSWYVYSETRPKDNDDTATLEKKELYRKICAHKKPYFFCYNYLYLRKEFKQYVDNVEKKSQQLFGCCFDDLKNKSDKTQEEEHFIKWATDCMPLDLAPSVMNRICWAVEKHFDDNLDLKPSSDFDYSILKSEQKYSQQAYNDIVAIYKNYKKQISEQSKKYQSKHYYMEDNTQDKKQIYNNFVESCAIACPNQYMLCDILIDICYAENRDKEIVWVTCGDVIVENLLKKHDNVMWYPTQNQQDYDFVCGGILYKMTNYISGGDEQ